MQSTKLDTAILRKDIVRALVKAAKSQAEFGQRADDTEDIVQFLTGNGFIDIRITAKGRRFRETFDLAEPEEKWARADATE